MKWRNILFIGGSFGLSLTLLFAFIRMMVANEPIWIWEPNLRVRWIELIILLGWSLLALERAVWFGRVLGNREHYRDQRRLTNSRKKR